MSDAHRSAEQEILRIVAGHARSALDSAIEIARNSKCAKSRRGVAIFDPNTGLVYGVGSNAPPRPFRCDGSDACRAACGKVAVHAEESAIVGAIRSHGSHSVEGLHLVHVKVVNGEAFPSGSPSCAECSKMVLAWGIAVVWLLHEDGLRPYEAADFHARSLRTNGLPVIL